ncbi:carbohydrate ABC transporter permease [Ethanoligenens harbinense]|uniref:Binding-protein-dependent transport systems inner membrane component n=1 Tax=Ethanoligenens harbinense (strain DSM 18485 / JCM 12961 / CGMCC 1.5033 / YUAN-3) TaxID=663278 RepID=E6U2N2_ETHHY|nr:carbohydrate ABC transporter permease [Ethanoligenens harbinense]ADU26323.1 binding-protein-dependent transport systems inner membrane component [Ethanoligenens harbinense YUAN-3]AVQ95457.1 carbohydrate ABC transporter permease [Ethanoligenens harbinense YUAN-3]AYF38121.1 carbohydrate ABC transporter permease [Ethanoligenens harbinense]AYF40867.1 carbohydrate ABC transporter permease [Ethanoligenens harbinense]QCN91697.1 carbohydrate ABC transporter permease [Ethanoligenens harbinense]
MKRTGTKAAIYIILTAASIIAIFPFIWTFIASTHNNTEIFNLSNTLIPKGNFLSNLTKLQQAVPIWNNLLNSLFITIVFTVLTLLIDSMAGYGFAKYRFKGKNVIFFACLITMMIPPQVTMVPLFIQMTKMNWVNTPWAIIIPNLAAMFGVFLMRQSFEQFPNDLIESSRIDGAGEISTFFRIVLPTMKPALASLGILTFVSQWGNYMWPLIVLNKADSYTLPLALAMLVAPGNVINYGAIMVGAVIALIPVLVFFLVFQKNFIQGMLSGAVKG